LKRSWNRGSRCACNTFTTASSTLTTSKAMRSPGFACLATSRPDGPALGIHEQPASSSAISQPQRTARFMIAMPRSPNPEPL